MAIHNCPVNLVLYAVQQWLPCHKYAKTGKGNNTNAFIKAISVWLILKNETSSGMIHSYRSQLPALAAKCKMSVRTLEHYINYLKREELVVKKENESGKLDLLMQPYKTLKKYDIDITKRLKTIMYDTVNATSLHEVLTAIGMDLFKRVPLNAYRKKVTKNQDALNELRNHLIAYGADEKRLDDPEYFRQQHLRLLIKTYREADPGQSSFYLLHKLIDANPDLNFKSATYAEKMGYSVLERTNERGKDQSVSVGFGHLKRRLAKKGVISVFKAHVESDWRARKDEKVFHHRYVRRTKQTIWFRPDQILLNEEIVYLPAA